MAKTSERYITTLLVSITGLVASVLLFDTLFGSSDGSVSQINFTTLLTKTVFYAVVWGIAGGLVAHEKGYPWFWIPATLFFLLLIPFGMFFILILLFLPYTQERQRKLQSPNDQSENNQSSILYKEKDNLGTRHDSKSISLAYWMGERMNSQRKDPFVMFTFKDKEFAEAALLQLPCIQVAQDSQKLICTERLIFGYYAIEDVYEAVLCGDALTVELWEQAKASFEEYGGEMKSELAPTLHAARNEKINMAQPGKVAYIREDHKAGTGGTAIYRIYKGPDEQSAMAFLKENPVTQDLLYLVIETPEGNFCRDKMGIYKED